MENRNKSPIYFIKMESANGISKEQPYVDISRPIFNQTHFDEDYGSTTHAKTIKDQIKKKISSCCICTRDDVKRKVHKFFPALKWMWHYDFRENILCDIAAGCTVAIMNIPQGMAYALLVGIPAINGLYVAFFPVLIYVLMGTSRHVCIGLVGVVSIMSGAVVERESTPNDMIFQKYNESNSTLSDVITYDAVQVATATAFFVGFLQFLMGIFNLGFVAIYLSESLVRGFTTGAAVHVFTSQMKNWFGISIPKFHGAFKVIYSFQAFFANINSTNLTEVIISVISILVLILVTSFINDKFKTKMKIPVPVELLVVIVATLASYFGNFQEMYNVKIVGRVPTGLLTPSIPPLALFPKVISDSFIISVVSYTITVSLAMIFAKKHNYNIYANQEMIALGSANLFGSIFGCPAVTGSLSRSLIQAETGGKTQVVGLVSCSIILIVLLIMGPLFKPLPVAVLSSIAIVALKGMFLQVLDLKRLWHISKVDFVIWLTTCTAVIILDVDIGLLIGVTVSFFTVIFRTQRPHCCIMGKIPHTDLYRDINQYKAAREVPKIKVFSFDSALYFANAEYFKNKLYEKTKLNPRKRLTTLNKLDHKRKKEEKLKQCLKKKAGKFDIGRDISISGDTCKILIPDTCFLLKSNPLSIEIMADTDFEGFHKVEDILFHHIVIDCSMMTFMDTVGANVILQVMQEYKDVNVTVFLANCKASLRQLLKSYDQFSEDSLFPTIHDAVIYALQQERKKDDCEEVRL